MRRDLTTTVGVILLLLSAAVYFACEAAAAAAWRHPPSSYARNYISDLGVPGPPTRLTGRVINSPLAYVMNAGLIGRGVLLVGLVHGSAYSIAHGAFVYHSLGVNLAIFGGSIASIVVGALWRRLPAPRWFGVASIVVGALGFVSLGLLALRTSAANTIPAAKHMEQR